MMNENLKFEIDNALAPTPDGSRKSSSYVWKSSGGPKLYVTVTFDEFYTIEGMIINLGASGSSMHNMCNALGRAISLGIQEIRKVNSARVIPFLQKMIDNLSGFSSEVVWMSETMGTVNSIPDVLGRILNRHIEMTEALEEMHSGEEEDEAS